MAADTRLEEETLGTFSGLQALFRLFGYTPGLRLMLAACIVGSLIASAIQVGLPLLFRQAVDTILAPTGASAATVVHLAWEYATGLIVYFVLAWIVALGLNNIGQQVVRRIRQAVFAHLHTLPITYFDHNAVGRLTTRVANDTDALSEVFASVIASAVGDVILLLGAGLAMVMLKWQLALWIGLLFPLLAAVTQWFRQESQRIYRTSRVLLARINAFFSESVAGLSVIKSFSAEGRMSTRFHALNTAYYDAEMSLVFALSIFRPLVGTAATLGTAIVLWRGGAMVWHGELTLGTLVAFLSYCKMLFSPIDELAEKLNLFQQALIASERIFRILDTPSESDGDYAPTHIQGRIEFDKVSFAYDPDKPVLEDVSFVLEPGETVALVGPTGSGKTTIASLLLGSYDLQGPGHGEIRVDGVPLRQWNRHALRRAMGLVQQDLFLFRTDLRHNITLFHGTTPQRLEAALSASQADRLVASFPDGLDHPVNERGTSLSQGERQLLSFARALVTDPPILVLDEATASIDSVTEKAIQEAMRRVLAGRTALIVAHRLSTVQEADRILVLKKGRIVEQGSHAVLMAANGLYAHLFRTQQLTAA